MNIVAPPPRASRPQPRRRLRRDAEPHHRPAGDRTGGRGRSAGSSSTGAPASCCRQYASWPSSTSPASHRRCHTAKSAYCTASGGSGSGSPGPNASYSTPSSRRKIPADHSSNDHVMHRQRQHMLTGGQPDQPGPDQRPGRQVERRRRVRRHQRPRRRHRIRPRPTRQPPAAGTAAAGRSPDTPPRPGPRPAGSAAPHAAATTAPSAAPSAATSSSPPSRTGDGTLYSTDPGSSWSRNHSRCCANDNGSR